MINNWNLPVIETDLDLRVVVIHVIRTHGEFKRFDPTDLGEQMELKEEIRRNMRWGWVGLTIWGKWVHLILCILFHCSMTF